jgi:hypothetical protein
VSIVYPDDNYAVIEAFFEVCKESGCGFLEPVTQGLAGQPAHGQKSAIYTDIQIRKLLKSSEDCPMTDARCRQVDTLCTPIGNKQIGSDDRVFSNQKASLDWSAQSPMSNFRCVHRRVVGGGWRKEGGGRRTEAGRGGRSERTKLSPNAGTSGKSVGPNLGQLLVEIERTKPIRVTWLQLRNTLWQFSLRPESRKRCHLTTATEEGRRAEEKGRIAEGKESTDGRPGLHSPTCPRLSMPTPG